MKENVVCCIRRHKRISYLFIVISDLVSVIFNVEFWFGGSFIVFLSFGKWVFLSHYQLFFNSGIT